MRKEVQSEKISTDDKDTNDVDPLPEVKSVSRWMCAHEHGLLLDRPLVFYPNP